MQAQENSGARRQLLHEVALFQLKLLLEGLCGLILVPVSLGAALLDFLLVGQSQPRLFRAVLAFGRRVSERIDLWPDSVPAPGPPANDVESVLRHVETLIRDPKSGADKARTLSRWARMQMSGRRRPK